MDYFESRRQARTLNRARARELRKSQTDAERRLWWLLRDRQLFRFRFRRQHAVGSFILDFFCPEAALAVEVDGGGHFTPEMQARDAKRTAVLRQLGIVVLRFDNVQVLGHSDVVLQCIADAVALRARGAPSP